MSSQIRVSSRAIIINDGKILMNEFGNGLYYNFPGGGIEQNETAAEAVVREVYEESSLHVEVADYVFTFEYNPTQCGNTSNNKHQMSLFFRCNITGNQSIQQPIVPDVNPENPMIVSEAKWVNICELINLPFVPKSIYQSLMEYIETGNFAPRYFQCSE